MMDVLGLRLGFTLAVAFWGLASMSHALVSTVAGFFVVRILLGLGEGSNFPAAIKTTAEWFPKREARACDRHLQFGLEHRAGCWCRSGSACCCPSSTAPRSSATSSAGGAPSS